MISALHEMSDQDQSLEVCIHERSGQIIIKGMSEEHLDIAVETLRRQHGFDVTVGVPRVSYREVVTEAGKVRFEPIMRLEVVTQTPLLGSVIADLSARRGQIVGRTTRGNREVVTAMAPLANMLGYGSDLKLMSKGEASHTMVFDHYEAVAEPSDAPDPDDTVPGAASQRA